MTRTSESPGLIEELLSGHGWLRKAEYFLMSATCYNITRKKGILWDSWLNLLNISNRHLLVRVDIPRGHNLLSQTLLIKIISHIRGAIVIYSRY